MTLILSLLNTETPTTAMTLANSGKRPVKKCVTVGTGYHLIDYYTATGAPFLVHH